MRPDEVSRLLQQTFRDEAAGMRVDTLRAARRLQAGTTGRAMSSGQRQGLVTVAAVLAVALLGWVLLSGRDQRAVPASPPQSSAPTSSATVIDVGWPYLLDLRTGASRAVPAPLLPPTRGLGANYAVDPVTGRIMLTYCSVGTNWGCASTGGVTISRPDETTRTRPEIPAGLSALVLDWSPNGQHVVFQATDGSNLAVGEFYRLDVDRGRFARLTNLPLDHAWWHDLRGSFSADSESFLFDLPRGAEAAVGWDVWSVPVQGGSATLRIKDAMAPEAIPGSRAVAVIRPRTGDWEGDVIELLEPNGVRHELVRALRGIGMTLASPDGSRLAYPDADATWVVDLDDGSTTRVSGGWPKAWVDDHTLLIVP